MINRISFIHPVFLGTEFGSVAAFDREKHGKHVDVAEKGSFFVLSYKGHKGPARSRVPITNIMFIGEDIDDAKPEKKP